jgi:hypothetical protein
MQLHWLMRLTCLVPAIPLAAHSASTTSTSRPDGTFWKHGQRITYSGTVPNPLNLPLWMSLSSALPASDVTVSASRASL